MALPALLLGPMKPEALPSEEARRVVERMTDLVRAYRDEYPPEGSPRERELLEQYARTGFELVGAAGAAWLKELDGRVESWLVSLLDEELKAANTERKLALRLLQQSLGLYARWAQAFLAELSSLPSLDEVMEAVAEVGLETLPDAVLPVFRWQMDLSVAFDMLGSAEDQELAKWARRCSASGRRAEAVLFAPPVVGVDGELARYRARHVWESWEQEEVDRELGSPWPVSGK